MTRLLYLGILLLALWLGLSYLTIPETPIASPKQFVPPTQLDADFVSFTQEYLSYFEGVMNRTKTPGAALAIIKDNSLYILQGFGVKKVNTAEPVDVNTVFRLGSLSKGVTAVLTGIMVDKGVFDWENPLKMYYPAFELSDVEQTERVSLKHLLSHTTGLPYHAYTDMVERGWDLDFINDHFKKVNLIAKEGEIYAYQNAVFSLIGEAMEEATGIHITSLLDLELFQPLGMANASTSHEAFIGSNNYAFPHAGSDGYWNKRRISKKYYNAIPAGGINASIADMAQYLYLLVGNRPELISEKTLDQIFEPLVNTRNKRKYFRRWPMAEEAFYGLGHRIVTTKDDLLVYHGGYVNGYKSEISIHRKDKIGICVLTSAPSTLSSVSIPTFWESYEKYKKNKNPGTTNPSFLLPDNITHQ